MVAEKAPAESERRPLGEVWDARFPLVDGGAERVAEGVHWLLVTEYVCVAIGTVKVLGEGLAPDPQRTVNTTVGLLTSTS